MERRLSSLASVFALLMLVSAANAQEIPANSQAKSRQQ